MLLIAGPRFHTTAEAHRDEVVAVVHWNMVVGNGR